MKLHRYYSALLLLSSTLGSAHATGPGDDPVLYWNQILSTGLAGSPTVTSRGFAMVDIAIFDAVIATANSPYRPYLQGVPTSGGDTRAAVAVAAHDVLVALNPAKAADFDAALAASLALVSNGSAKSNGMASGAAIASAMLAARATDGSATNVPYTPSGLPGRWAPTPPGFAPAAVPQWGGVDPWILNSGDQFRPAPPPDITSAEYTLAYQQVMDIGSATSTTRTADQTASALFWAGAAGTGPWIQAAIGRSEAKGLTTIENAQLFALLATTTADAAIAVWDTKYFYDYWRPITAIRNGDIDGNPDTVADPNWISLIVAPAFPSYASAHATVAGAAAGTLAALLGDAGNFCLTAGGNSRCWASFSDASQDAANSREWGGIHWSFDNETGLVLGADIADFALAGGYFRAVPEPLGWSLLLGGIGLVGGVLRARRRTLPNKTAPWAQAR
jgi:hypothetical protein